MILDTLQIPIVLAPLAGGPATVELAVAVSDAGGLGFLAAGYRTAADMREQVQAFRARSELPFGVNVFAPPPPATEPGVYATYVERLQREARLAGVRLGEPRHDDDDWAAKLAALSELAVPVVSFVFGCPAPDAIAALRVHGSSVWVTVTSPAEARQAEDAGADALVLQGYEAGGHRASFSDSDEAAYGLLALLQLVGARANVPLIAAGGVATGRGVAAALAAGARAAQIGTAFLRCPEAGTSGVHRTALVSPAPTPASPRAPSSTASCASTTTHIPNCTTSQPRCDRPRDGAAIATSSTTYVTSPGQAPSRTNGRRRARR